MRISLAASAVLLAPIFVACDQPISPTGPTPSSSAAPSISSVGAAGTATLIGDDASASPFKITEVPFKGTFEGVLTVSTPTEPPLLPSFIEATGHATHLGRFTLEVPHVVNPVTRIGTGRFEFRGANGDMLTADFVGHATVIAPGVLSTVDTATITGGTGRFANATGSFTGGRTFVLSTGAVGVLRGDDCDGRWQQALNLT